MMEVKCLFHGRGHSLTGVVYFAFAVCCMFVGSGTRQAFLGELLESSQRSKLVRQPAVADLS